MDTHTDDQPTPDQPTPEKHSWRGLASSRKAMAAGVVAAGLVLGGAGFGVGYAVGDEPARTDIAQQDETTDGGWGDHGLRGGPDGDMGGGRMGVPPGGDRSGQAPDLDGDGQPDTDSSTQLS